MPKYVRFMFSIPTLPGDVYATLKNLMALTGLSQWQVVVLGITTLANLEAPERDSLVEFVKEHYPKPAG